MEVRTNEQEKEHLEDSGYGRIFGFLGTMMQGYAEDKDLDARIDEAVEKKLNESHETEGQ